jgi:hypothetical protein
MYANVIVGVDGREGGRDAAALTTSAAPVDDPHRSVAAV